jgi:signal peptidase II
MISLLILFVDQSIKHIIRGMMVPGLSYPVIEHIFHITYVLNPGAAFGIFAYHRAMFIVIGIVLLSAAAMLYPKLRQQGVWIRYGAALLLGGAMGNLWDRIWYGYVIDFLDFRIWPVFNVADIAIVCGVGCIIYALLRGQQRGV